MTQILTAAELKEFQQRVERSFYGFRPDDNTTRLLKALERVQKELFGQLCPNLDCAECKPGYQALRDTGWEVTDGPSFEN